MLLKYMTEPNVAKRRNLFTEDACNETPYRVLKIRNSFSKFTHMFKYLDGNNGVELYDQTDIVMHRE